MGNAGRTGRRGGPPSRRRGRGDGPAGRESVPTVTINPPTRGGEAEPGPGRTSRPVNGTERKPLAAAGVSGASRTPCGQEKTPPYSLIDPGPGRKQNRREKPGRFARPGGRPAR